MLHDTENNIRRQHLQQIETQSQELQAVIHSRLAYVAAINQQWDASRSHHHQAQQYLNSTKPESLVIPWLVAQQHLTETLLPEIHKPVTTQPLSQRLALTLQVCEKALSAESEIAPNHQNDPYQTFWHAVLPRDTLLAELAFRTASALDAARRAPNTLPSQPTAHQLYELAYTRLLESNQPFAAASAAANRAALHTEAHEYDNAIPWLQRALNLEEANEWVDEAAESHQRLAKAYAKTQQWQSALHHGDCVLQWLQNNDASVTQHEAISRWQQRLGQWANTEGLPNQAKVYWLQALETLYALRRQGPLTPEQQSRQDDLEAWIRREA